ncbi:hypothetical protein KUTeg_019434 [Tegillarca granosa]|uniref:Calcineurin-like phosphoesterase domain-containing protein n=1 Tax=Tegillarca granosa TaxID=220873 RepID=A0ABQ9ECI4_TEGGR|nr:hypothetical protein KUTeg_019434 [Tegillarca granosa]
MWVICQFPSRCCFYIRTNKCSRLIFLVLLLLFYCEFLHYYLVLLFCTWPSLTGKNMVDFVATESQHRPLKAMFIADTHILGFKDGHWFDKLRREWQMERSFQTAMMIHSPDVVFILGDLLDEGKWCSQLEFQYHVSRFHKMFQTPAGVHTEILVGNHDVGFHYMMSERNHRRFEHAFDAPAVKLLEIKGNLFVMLNSMAMEGDGCNLCSEAVEKLEEISWQLKCAKGTSERKTVAKLQKDERSMFVLFFFLLLTQSSPKQLLSLFNYEKILTGLCYSELYKIKQHFPMYRQSDANCSLPDAAPVEEKEIPFREKWDCLSKEATQQLFDWINPRLIISAHTHHGCYRIHDHGTPEWTGSNSTGFSIYGHVESITISHYQNTILFLILLVVDQSKNFLYVICYRSAVVFMSNVKNDKYKNIWLKCFRWNGSADKLSQYSDGL